LSEKSLAADDDFDNEAFTFDSDEPQIERPTPDKLADASNARRPTEDHWEQRALEEELKKFDDQDDADPAR